MPTLPLPHPNEEPVQARFLDRREAAAFLTERGYPTARTTLAKLFSIGGGPPVQHFGRKPLYAPRDLVTWAESRLSAPRRNSSEPRLPATMRAENESAREGS